MSWLPLNFTRLRTLRTVVVAWLMAPAVLAASLRIKGAFWALVGVGVAGTRWWHLRRLSLHAQPLAEGLQPSLSFWVYAAGTLVGHTALESGDTSMGVAFGTFIPTPGYAAIRSFCSSQHGDQSVLQLRVETPENDTIVCAGVGIMDFSGEVGEEAIEINVLGIEWPPYETLFPGRTVGAPQ